MLGQIGKYAIPIGVVSFGFPECPLGRLRPDSTRSASFKCVTPDPSANDTGSLMSGGDGKIGLHRPITVSRVQISVADPTRHDFHQGLPGPGVGTGSSRSTSGSRNFSTTAALIIFGIAILDPP